MGNTKGMDNMGNCYGIEWMRKLKIELNGWGIRKGIEFMGRKGNRWDQETQKE